MDYSTADGSTLVLAAQSSLSLKSYLRLLLCIPEESRSISDLDNVIKALSDLKVCVHIPVIAENLADNIKLASELVPNNWKFLNILAGMYYELEVYDAFALIAFECFDKAEQANDSCIDVERKLLFVMWHLLPRWHFRMLNGKLRNTAYQKAIHKALEAGFTTCLDIGAGCGLLSLYLGTHNSKPTITLFESNETLYDLAISNLNDYCPDIIIDSHLSNSNSVENTKFKSNLLVTEIFDVGVFGEGILSTLLHSFKYHINIENFRLIPAKVNIYVTGISCKDLDRKFRLQNEISRLCIDEYVCATRCQDGDPYQAENILDYNFQVLTETVNLMELNFHDREKLDFIYNNQWKTNLSLKGIKSGVIDCLVVWFDLHLDDEITISTNPFHENNEPCWEQAIFHCPSPLKISENEELTLMVSVKDEHLLFENINPTVSTIPHFELDEEGIEFLNDKEWINFLITLSERINTGIQLTIFDFSHIPVLGLLLAKKGHKIIHVTQNLDNKAFIEYLIQKNQINQELFSTIEKKYFPFSVQDQNIINYVFYEPFLCGRLNPSPFDNFLFRVYEANSFFTEVIVHFTLIDSKDLDYWNKVSYDNVEPFENLANKINIFTGSEHPSLPSNFSYECITIEQKWNIKENPLKVFKVEILKDAKVNAILHWFTVTGIGGVQFSNRESSYFKLTALLQEERKVEKNQNLNVRCIFENGDYKIEIDEESNNAGVNAQHSMPIRDFFVVYKSKYI